MSAPHSRRNEIEAKRARLAELKRQRDLRSKELAASRQNTGETSELVAPTPTRANNRAELDDLVSRLVDRPRSAAPKDPASPAVKVSGPTSAVNATQHTGQDRSDVASPAQSQNPVTVTQTLSLAPLATIYDFPASPKPAIVTYSKGVQTSDFDTSPLHNPSDFSTSEDEHSSSRPRSRTRKRLSRRGRERDEELRQNIRKELEAELRALKLDEPTPATQARNFPSRNLTDEEVNAVTASEDFYAFVERSSKVIERALGEEYDVLADYALNGLDAQDEDDADGVPRSRKGRRIKELYRFYDGRWSKRRMISALDFSPKFPELLLSGHTKNQASSQDAPGLVLVWNSHNPSRPEYTFTATSDIVSACFSPFHPNLILGGTYSGQVCLWDTRARHTSPVQKTPLSGGRGGHAHPVYSLAVVGTTHANSVISVSTDGIACAWSFDMLSVPQEYLELSAPPQAAKYDEVSPTCISCPKSDPTYFLAGTEEG
ncbi:hypothetical protein LTR66_002254, partial [Elasticomyces elasticus]